MVKKKQKVYLSVGILLLQTTLMAEGLASILISQKTKDSVIENKNFDGENLYSFLWGSTDFLSSSLGSYITIGGTVDFRSDEDKQRDEKSGDFDNYLSYNVYNTGLTYTPTNNLTLLGGVGYGQSKGKYYQKNTTSNNYSELVTEKEKGVNFNLAVNYYYKSIGLVAMYDTFPKVFSVGVSYNFGGDKDKNNRNGYRKQSNKTLYTNNKKPVQKKKKKCKDGQSDISRAWSSFVGIVNGGLRATGTINDGKSANEGYEWGKKAGSEQIIPKLLDAGCK